MTTSSTGGGEVHAFPPQPPTVMAPGDGAGSVTFALHKLYLGDTKPDGTPDQTNGWKNYGYDVDGDLSTATSTNLCKPRDGAAPKNVYPDGPNGLDNAFGRNILPIMLSIASDTSSKVNAALEAGDYTLLFDIDKLGASATYNPLVARFYDGAQLVDAGGMPIMPKFDGTDTWPVNPKSLSNPMDISTAKQTFPAAYLTDNTFVTGTLGDIEVPLKSSGFTWPLHVHHAVVSFQLDAAHKHAAQGILSGVLNTEELTTEMKKIAGSFDPSLCSGATIDSIIAQITQASDILSDGSQDPTKDCDGITIGLGMDLEIVKIGTIADPEPPPTDPCMMTP